MSAGGYMATCHVAMEYRIRLLSQGAGRIFLTENLHPTFRSLTAPVHRGS